MADPLHPLQQQQSDQQQHQRQRQPEQERQQHQAHVDVSNLGQVGQIHGSSIVNELGDVQLHQLINYSSTGGRRASLAESENMTIFDDTSNSSSFTLMDQTEFSLRQLKIAN